MPGNNTQDLQIQIALQQVAQLSAQLGRVQAQFTAFSGRTTKQLNSVQKAVNGLAAEIPLLGRALSLLSSPMTILAATTAAVAVQFTKAVGTARQFEKQIANTASIVGVDKTTAAFRQLTAEALRLGSTTEFSATQAARAMEFLARAGLNTQQIVAATADTLSLATIGNLELGRAADIATNVMSTFNIAAADLGSVVDIISKTTTTSNTTVQTFAESIKFLGPVANALNITLAETAATIGILGNSGLQGGRATRALTTSVLGLANPTKEAAAEIQRLGLQVFDQEGEFQSLSAVLGQLQAAFDDYTPKQQQAAIATIFGKEATGAWNILLQEGSASLATYAAEIQQAAAEQGKFSELIRKARLDTFDGAVTELSSAWEGFQIAIARGSLPALKDLALELAEVVRTVTEFIATTGSLSDFLQENAELVVLATTAVLAYNAATIRATAANVAAAVAERATNVIRAAQIAITNAAIVAQYAYIVATQLMAGEITLATAAMELFNLVVAANPLGLIITAIGLATAAFLAFQRSASDAESAAARFRVETATNSEVINRVTANLTDAKVELDNVFSALTNATRGTRRHTEAVQLAQDRYGQYIGNIDLANASVDELRKAYEKLNTEIVRNLVIQEQEKEVRKVLESALKISTELAQLRREFGAAGDESLADVFGDLDFGKVVAEANAAADSAQALTGALGAQQLAVQDAAQGFSEFDAQLQVFGQQADALAKEQQLEQALQDTENQIGQIGEQFKDLSATLAQGLANADFSKLIQQTGEAVKGAGDDIDGATAAAVGSITELQNRIRDLNEDLEAQAPDSGLIPSLQKQIRQAEFQLDRLQLKLRFISIGFEDIPAVQGIDAGSIPSADLSADITGPNSDALQVDALENYRQAVEQLGLDWQFVNQEFDNAGQLMDFMASTSFQLAESLGAQGQAAADLALGLDEVGRRAEAALIDGAGRAMQKLGQEFGKAIAGAQTFGQAMGNVFKALVETFLVEVPRLVGLNLLSLATVTPPPANIPLVIAGLALIGASGLAGGLLSGFEERARAQSTPSLNSGIGGSGSASIGGGLSSQGAAQETRPNLTIIVQIDSDGILKEVDRQSVVNTELLNGG